MWNKVFRKNESVVSRKIAEEMLLVPVRGRLANMQRIFTLNPVAEYIWQELDGQRNLGDIRSGVLRTFEVKKDQAGKEISEFIDELLEADLIREVG
ncbi:MAG: PqqD family protein [Deltaproteobacteria bacterium]|nr:PqqD family protein [Deltaproteobacteria bacterium]